MILLRNTLVKLGIDLISACQKDTTDSNPEEKISTAVCTTIVLTPIFPGNLKVGICALDYYCITVTVFFWIPTTFKLK